MRLKKSLAAASLIAMAGVTLFACGYRFSGSGELPAGVETIFIAVLENRTSNVGVETTFTDDLINQFILNRKDALASRSRADAVLSGVIDSIFERRITQTGGGESIQRELTVVVSLRLNDQQGRQLWSARNVQARQTFEVGASRQETDQNKREAYDYLSDKLSQRIYNRLTEDF
jgi:hypothetical protein